MSNQVRMLLRYKAWANEEFFTVLSGLSDEQLDAAHSIIFGSINRTLNHLCAMDEVWKCHLQGRYHGFTTRSPQSCPPFEEICRRQRELDGWYTQYADQLDEDGMGETVEFAFIGGGAGSMSRSDILLHVVNHATYHRGNISSILYEIDVMPPTTDLPVYLRHIGS